MRWDRGERAAVRPERRRTSRTPTSSSTTRTARPAIPKSVVVDDALRLGGRRARRKRPWGETVIYETHVKGFTMQHPGVREDLRGTYAGLASEAAIEHLRRPRRHRGRAAARAPHRRRALPRRAGPDELLGLLVDRLPRAARRRTRRAGRRGEQVREFKGMVKALHRAGIEVILDVVYNHTAEGNHLGPMLSFKGVDNKSYYRLSPDDQRHYMDYTGTGNTLDARVPSVLRLIMDSLRYFVDRVPRRRLPLRPRQRAGARALRRRPALGVLRRHPPGPGALAGQAHRRAVGRRARRLPGRQLPGAVDRVERHVPRRRARLLARRRRRSPSSPPASPARATSTRTTAARRSRRSTSSPRTTASRCATSSPTTRSTTRPTSRTTATAPTTTARGTAASRARPTTRRSSRCAPASSATSSRRCSSRSARRCCSAATR